MNPNKAGRKTKPSSGKKQQKLPKSKQRTLKKSVMKFGSAYHPKSPHQKVPSSQATEKQSNKRKHPPLTARAISKTLMFKKSPNKRTMATDPKQGSKTGRALQGASHYYTTSSGKQNRAYRTLQQRSTTPQTATRTTSHREVPRASAVLQTPLTSRTQQPVPPLSHNIQIMEPPHTDRGYSIHHSRSAKSRKSDISMASSRKSVSQLGSTKAIKSIKDFKKVNGNKGVFQVSGSVKQIPVEGNLFVGSQHRENYLGVNSSGLLKRSMTARDGILNQSASSSQSQVKRLQNSGSRPGLSTKVPEGGRGLIKSSSSKLGSSNLLRQKITSFGQNGIYRESRHLYLEHVERESKGSTQEGRQTVRISSVVKNTSNLTRQKFSGPILNLGAINRGLTTNNPEGVNTQNTTFNQSSRFYSKRQKKQTAMARLNLNPYQIGEPANRAGRAPSIPGLTQQRPATRCLTSRRRNTKNSETHSEKSEIHSKATVNSFMDRLHEQLNPPDSAEALLSDRKLRNDISGYLASKFVQNSSRVLNKEPATRHLHVDNPIALDSKTTTPLLSIGSKASFKALSIKNFEIDHEQRSSSTKRLVSERYTVEERVGEPQLVEVIEHDPKLIHEEISKKTSHKALIVESLQRLILISMENDRLASKNSYLEAENKGLVKTVRSLEDRIKGFETIRADFEQSEAQKAKFEAKMTEVIGERTLLLQEIESLRFASDRQRGEMLSKMKIMISENKKFKTELLSIEKNYEEELAELRKLVSGQTGEFDELRTAKKKLEIEVKNLREELEALDVAKMEQGRLVVELEAEKRALEVGKTELEGMLGEFEKGEGQLKELFEEVEARNRALEAEKEELVSANKIIQTELEGLEGTLKRLEKVEFSETELKNTLKTLETDLKGERVKSQNLESKVTELLRVKKTLELQVKSVKSQLTLKKIDFERSQKEAKKLKNKLEMVEGELEEQGKLKGVEVDALGIKLKDLEGQMESLEARNGDLLQKLDLAQKELELKRGEVENGEEEVEKLLGTVEELQSKVVVSLEVKLERVVTENTSLAKEVKKQRVEVEEVKLKLENAQKDMDLLKNQKIQQEAYIQKLEVSLEDRKQSDDVVSQEKADLRSKIAELESKLEKNLVVLGELEKALELKITHIGFQEAKIEGLEVSKTTLEAKIGELKTELQTQKKRSEGSGEQVEELQSHKMHLITQIETLKLEYSHSINKNSEELEALKKLLERQQREAELMSAELKRLRDLNNKQSDQLDDSKVKSSQLEAKISEYSSKVLELENQSWSHKTELVARTREIQEYKNKAESLEKSVTELRERESRLKIDLKASQRAESESGQRFKLLEVDKYRLESELTMETSKHKEMVSVLDKELKEAKSQLFDKTENLKIVASKLDSEKERSRELNQELVRLRLKFESLISDEEIKSKQVSRLETDFQHSKKDYEQLRCRFEELEDCRNHVEQKLESTTQENISLKNELDSKERSLRALETELESLRRLLESQQSKFEEELEKVSSAELELKSKIEEYIVIIEENQDKLRQLEEQIGRSRQERERLVEEVQEYQIKVIGMSEAHRGDTEQLRGDYEARVRSKTELITELNSKVAESSKRVIELESVIEELRGQARDSENGLEAKHASNISEIKQRHKKELEGYSTQIEGLREVKLILETRIGELNSRLDLKAKECSDFKLLSGERQRDLDSVRTSLEARENRLEALLRRIEELEHSLRVSETRAEALESELESTRQEFAAILQEYDRKRELVLEESQRLKILCRDRLREIENKSWVNGKVMTRLVMAYLEIERLNKFAKKKKPEK